MSTDSTIAAIKAADPTGGKLVTTTAVGFLPLIIGLILQFLPHLQEVLNGIFPQFGLVISAALGLVIALLQRLIHVNADSQVKNALSVPPPAGMDQFYK